MAEPLLLCDAGLVVLAANKEAVALLKTPAAGIVQRNAEELLPRRVLADSRPPFLAHARLEWRSEFERDGNRFTLEVSGTALRDEQSGVDGWVLTLKDLGAPPNAPDFLGRSAVTQELLEFVSRIAASNATSILLLGESGTGKELIAQRLHALSPRAAAPFVPINCAALPETLLESELFGYEKGAFTNAAQAKEGLFETADGGCVFLDEIGELPLPLQAKLLRVLEERTFRRIGGTRDISVNLRVIGATNSDLDKGIAEKRFRGDLYYRLNGVQIQLPALRERPEDIQELAMHFLSHFNRVHRRHLRGIHPGAQRMLDLYTWPGNVRELRNIMERAVLVESAPIIMPASLALPHRGEVAQVKIAAASNGTVSTPFSLRNGEQELILAALAEANGNQSRAAGLLGIGRFSLRYKMKKLGML